VGQGKGVVFDVGFRSTQRSSKITSGKETTIGIMKEKNNKNIDNNNSIEVADIFNIYGEEYCNNNKMTKKQHKVMTNIANCRTSWFGYHEDKCDNCGHIESDFNSCRDRHCPKCQAISRKKWVKARLDDILPVPYYHVIFTLPHLLYDLLPYNKELIYNLLFSCASSTLLAFGHDPKWLGGEIGFIGVLHTWGQTLWQHPHLHFLVPGGALTDDDRWVAPPYHGKFLFPVHSLSIVFKGKFIEGLKEAHACGDLVIPPEAPHLAEAIEFRRWLNRFAARKWVIFCKSPLNNPEQVVRYIGRYTHRVAISNSRILQAQDGKVTFNYKDYKDNRVSRKVMCLDAQEFIRRFLWHTLPSGFHKIRHFGFLANGRRKSSIHLIKGLFNAASHEQPEEAKEVRKPCPKCGDGSLIPQMIVTRFGRVALAFASFFKGIHGGYAYDST
jgi:hypothetical protein